MRQDVDRYLAVVSVSCHSLFDRDTIPGAEPEELLALKLPDADSPRPYRLSCDLVRPVSGGVHPWR